MIPHPQSIPGILPALSLLGVLLLPLALDAQDGGAVRLGIRFDADRASHSDHAGLHRLRPADAAVEIVALETIRDLNGDADALCQAARLALTAGLLSSGEAQRLAWFRRGESYALTARTLRPDDPDPMFALAAAIGLQAHHQPLRQRIRSAERVLELTDSILARHPHHPGGLHLRGQLTAVAMRLNPMVRFVVERVLGGEILAQASWSKAEADFRRALDAEPDNPAHRIELAELLHNTGRTEEAQSQLQRALATRGTDALTTYHRQQARTLLDGLR